MSTPRDVCESGSDNAPRMGLISRLRLRAFSSLKPASDVGTDPGRSPPPAPPRFLEVPRTADTTGTSQASIDSDYSSAQAIEESGGEALSFAQISDAESQPRHDPSLAIQRTLPAGIEVEAQIATQIRTRLKVQFKGTVISQPSYSRSTWQDPREFIGYDRQARTIIQQSNETPSDDNEQIYLELGVARAIYDGEQEEVNATCFLDSQKDWASHLQKMVAKVLAVDDPYPILLEIDLSYASVCIPECKHNEFASTIRTTLHNNLVTNFQNKSFLPRKVLLTIFSETVVERLIEEDVTLTASVLEAKHSPWKSKQCFAEHVNLHGTALLALCIYMRVELVSMFYILEKVGTETGVLLQTRELRIEDRPETVKEVDFNILLENQSKFNVHVFDQPGRRRTHDSLSDAVVVPLLYDGNQPAEYNLGDGGFGKVDRVRIHPQHHSFAPNRSKAYALKVLYERHKPGARAMEEEILRKLKIYSHPNIVLHLAAFTQNDVFHLVYECALGGDLRKYMEKTPPVSNSTWASSLLRNLHELASALQHIHKAALVDVTIPGGKTLGVPEPFTSTACHFDLKPENILVYTDGKDTVSWKISDFGVARIYHVLGNNKDYVTHKTRSMMQGEAAYSSPDFQIQRRISRPHDVWSLGCIFLEVLLWALELPSYAGVSFQEARLISPPPTVDSSQTQAFWYGDRHQSWAQLKPAVVERLESLRDHCSEWGVLGEVVDMTIEMMRLRPNERPKAAVVASELEGFISRAIVDAEHQPDCYDKQRRGRKLKHTPRRDRHDTATVVSRSQSRESLDRQPAYLGETIARVRPGSPTALRLQSRRQNSAPAGPTLGINTTAQEGLIGAGSQLLTPPPVTPTRASRAPWPTRSRSRSPSVTVRDTDGESHLLFDEALPDDVFLDDAVVS